MLTFYELHVLLHILTVLSFVATVSAVDFGQCLAEVRSGAWGITGITDNHGNPLANVTDANAITYALCVRACGHTPEPFDIKLFNQQFSTWLLPYLALLSQLPFGAESRLSNFQSLMLTVGSPALAAYSLALTVLNGRWVARRFRGVAYPNADRAATILRSLQTAPGPVHISTTTGHLPSLVALHQNDEWWTVLFAELKHSSTWSGAAVMSMVWVGVAFIFTLVSAFMGLPSSSSPSVRVRDILDLFGQGIGFQWLWLVPVAYGWIQVAPLCDADRLRRVFAHVDQYAHIATSDGSSGPEKASKVSKLRGLTISCFPDYSPVPAALADVERCAPIFNYARVFTFSDAVEDVASTFASAADHARRHERVDSVAGQWVESTSYGVSVHPDNRTGSLEQVMKYCTSPFSLRKSQRRAIRKAYERIVLSAFIGIALQWGTTGSALLIVYLAPTQGLGCTSGVFVLYASISTLSLFFMIASSIFAHHATPSAHRLDLTSDPALAHRTPSTLSTLSPGWPWPRVAGALAVSTRRAGKVLAHANALFVLCANISEYGNALDNCWCNSRVPSLGLARAYTVVEAAAADLGGMRAGWIGGVCLGVVVVFAFAAFVHLLLDGKAD